MANFLTIDQKKQLLTELRSEKMRRHADRIRIILLLDEGITYKSIAKHFFIDEGSIANYRKRYTEGGLDALTTDQHSGKMCHLGEKEIEIFSQHLEKNLFNSTKDIIRYVKGHFGTDFTVSGITKLLHRIGFSYKKAKATPVKAVKELQEEFLKKYHALKNEGKIYFGDSTHPHWGTIVTNGWIKTGQDHPVLTNNNSHRKRININGAVCLDNLEVIVKDYEKINADTMCDLIGSLRGQNKKEENIFLILDNASYNDERARCLR